MDSQSGSLPDRQCPCLDELTARRIERARFRPRRDLSEDYFTRLAERNERIAANVADLAALAAAGDTRFGTFGVVPCQR
ncbi:MAG: hypothetical protein WAL12_20970 [Trebonia sp.]